MAINPASSFERSCYLKQPTILDKLTELNKKICSFEAAHILEKYPAPSKVRQSEDIISPRLENTQ